MNWRHFQAFVWLRWRLMANQWRRAGAFNAALMIVLTVCALVSVIPSFFACLVIAVYAIPKATPDQLMYAWDGLIAAFLLFWAIGLLTDLQRNDPLSLSKFLHLPVSVNAAFLINYLSSLVRLSLLCFAPVMAAYALALVYVQGVAQLPVLLSLLAFFLLITAPTYQFQGWLASLVNNPRRRRAVVVSVTMGFVLVFQLPNLINFYLPRQSARLNARSDAYKVEQDGIQKSFDSKEIDAETFANRRKEAGERFMSQTKRDQEAEQARLVGWARMANMLLPIGWLPIGVMAAAEGDVIPSLLGVAGMTLLGSFSLWRAYRTTIGQFQGQSSNRKNRAPADRKPDLKSASTRGWLLEARLPGLSEPVSAIALGSFRSLIRSPEAKISLLSPLIMGAVFGSILLRGKQDMPISTRPMLGIAAIAFVLFGLLQLMGNQFGMDRDGFRVYVLCAAPRRDILLGKNLAYIPAAFLLAILLVTAVQVLCPMRIDHVLAMFPQFISMYLLFCVIANLFSIFAPVYIAAGTLKAANPKLSTILLQMVMFLVLFPLSQGLSMIPLGSEMALNALGWSVPLPVCLLLTLAECGLVVLLYYLSLGWFGGMLQSREQRILETVTNRAL